MVPDQKVWDWRGYILRYGPDNPTYRHVLLTLSCYMDSAGGSCFPSIDTLCDATKLSRPPVVGYLKQAKEDGWINTKQHGFGGQQWRRNEYTASIPQKVVKQINHVTEKVVNEVSEGGKPESKKVVNEVNSISSLDNSPLTGESPELSRQDYEALAMKASLPLKTVKEKAEIALLSYRGDRGKLPARPFDYVLSWILRDKNRQSNGFKKEEAYTAPKKKITISE